MLQHGDIPSPASIEKCPEGLGSAVPIHTQRRLGIGHRSMSKRAMCSLSEAMLTDMAASTGTQESTLFDGVLIVF